MAFWIEPQLWIELVILCVICIVFLQLHLVYGRYKLCQSPTLLGNKTVIVTGGSRGIGYEVALEMAKRRAKVIIGSPNSENGLRAVHMIRGVTGNPNIIHIPLDLGDIKSVHNFAAEILECHDADHILINNAAIAYSNQQQGYYHDPVFAVNYLGHFLLTYLLLERLKQSTPSRIINVTCLSHKFVVSPLDFTLRDPSSCDNVLFPRLTEYLPSRLAMVLHAKELSRRLAGTGVIANSVHPGFALTGMWSDMSIAWPKFVCWLIMQFMRPMTIAAHQAAHSVVYCAVADEVAGVSGKYFEKCCLTKESPLAQDANACKTLWDISALLVGCTPKGAVPIDIDMYDESMIKATDNNIYWCLPEKKKEHKELVEKIIISRT